MSDRTVADNETDGLEETTERERIEEIRNKRRGLGAELDSDVTADAFDIDDLTTTTAVSRPIHIDVGDDDTVIACLDCGVFYEQATDEWERCPVCGDALVRLDPAGDRR